MSRILLILSIIGFIVLLILNKIKKSNKVPQNINIIEKIVYVLIFIFLSVNLFFST